MAPNDAELDKELRALGLSRTVYSFYYPEVRSAVGERWDEKPHYLFEKPYTDGNRNLHNEFAGTWREWAGPVCEISPAEFPYFYPCAGSSEGIRDAISQLGRQRARIHIFRGEYEGYRAYAKAYGVEVIEHDRENYRSGLASLDANDYFFLSQPSSLDGNIWAGAGEFLDFAVRQGFKVALDLCYVGATAKPFRVPVNSAVQFVFFSLSKIYGVYFHRIGGIFRRTESLSLAGNEFFHNKFSLHLGKCLLEKFGPFDLPGRYSERRDKIVRSLQEKLQNITGADVIMLASGPAAENGLGRYVKRNNYARVCLTPRAGS